MDDVDNLVTAAACVIWVRNKSGQWKANGTGCRIAPEFVVTCAHVVVAAGGRVEVEFGDGTRFGADVAASTDAVGGFDDLAVLRLDGAPAADATCALMVEAVIGRGTRLQLCAYNADYAGFLELGAATALEFSTHEAGEVGATYLKLTGNQRLLAGMSGGPVVLPGQGVIGLVKQYNNRNPTGGAAVRLLAGLRRLCAPGLYREVVGSHDRYHRADMRWSDVVGGEATIRRLLIDLNGVCTGLPTAVQDQLRAELTEVILANHLDVPTDWRVIRDLAEYVAIEAPGDDGLNLARCAWLIGNRAAADPDREAIVAIARRAAGRRFVNLDRSMRNRFGRLAPKPPRPGGVPITLFAIITPDETPGTPAGSEQGHRYEIHRRTGDGDIIGVRSATSMPSFTAAKAAVKVALDDQLQHLDADGAEIEIVVALPDEYLTADLLCRWLRPDERPFRQFMMRLRRSATWEKPAEQIRELEQRWNRLRAGGALAWLACADDRSGDLRALHALVEADGLDVPVDALGIAEPPTPAVFAAAGANALPVLIWRDESCPDRSPGHLDCGGPPFVDRLVTELGDSGWIDGHPVVWREQCRSAKAQRDNDFWLRVGYVLDIPGHSRRKPHPLAGPPAVSGGFR
ncbi:serine protease [Nocardia sp. NPDC060249]|uniref:S1 family peptidase n=1 Tax=Nocardia sp. NPDC060249 TaxID=3347082 RepID=UPI003657F089